MVRVTVQAMVHPLTAQVTAVPIFMAAVVSMVIPAVTTATIREFTTATIPPPITTVTIKPITTISLLPKRWKEWLAGLISVCRIIAGKGSQSFANSSTTYNNYNNYGSYNNGYNNTVNSNLNQVFQPPINPELVSRLQCVAKNIRLEDFDLSVSKLLQQGGMLLAVQLQQKYPQLSYWINVAALAISPYTE